MKKVIFFDFLKISKLKYVLSKIKVSLSSISKGINLLTFRTSFTSVSFVSSLEEVILSLDMSEEKKLSL